KTFSLLKTFNDPNGVDQPSVVTGPGPGGAGGSVWLTFFGSKGVYTAGTTVSGKDRKSTRLNSSHVSISYAVFCLKKKKLPQHDINNTIDHRPEGDEKWFLENEKTVTQFCLKLAAERPLKDIRDEYNYHKKKGIKDESSRLLEASTMKSRRGFAIQRLMNAMRQAHADGWFIVFFFFSSRRRHTKSKRDWSSDVCSSDLIAGRRSPLSPRGNEPARFREVAKGRRSEERRVGKECRSKRKVLRKKKKECWRPPL